MYKIFNVHYFVKTYSIAIILLYCVKANGVAANMCQVAPGGV